ncbi:MAG: FAD-dependent oxidoreductase [Coleofasciculaceae cyanobacterium SM2_3_26]|nr:FAD-dependent oxidoreductase [Coleofasciculaceae cyanobacterium SM2_3_26]
MTGIGVAVPPLPAFNFGIESAQAANIDNLGIIGRASGYRGVAVAVGRIQTLNVYQGQAIGVAAAIASRAGVPLNTIPSAEVRQTLEQMTGLTTVLHGKNTMDGKDYGIQ